MLRKPLIVFLDAATVDLGDVDLSSLAALGRYRGFSDTRPAEIARHAAGARVLITNKCVLGDPQFSRLPDLSLVCAAATGVNHIDLEAARKRGIAVANVPGYSTATVAEHALMFLLALSHRLDEHHRACRDGTWSRSRLFTVLDYPFEDLAGKTLGVVGYGAIGRRVVRLARAFGMKVMIARLPGRRYPAAPKRTAFRDLLRRSDFVTLHCPLTPSTRHLIDGSALRIMKPSACLLNLARGPLVRESDVARALLDSRIRAYAADVLGSEPPPGDHPLLDPRLEGKVLLTPHIAWASREARQRLVGEIAGNIRAFQNGRRRNRLA